MNLTSSMSTDILVHFFNEIIQKVIFHPKIEKELQMYLFKFADKIV